jgi:ParB/RepB/Spo0J family partition protein
MPTAPTVTPDIRTIPLGDLHESPMNTRRHFDEHKLADLTASMRTTGQLTPILARPSTLPKKAGYEIAAGHRRRRAAELAGLDSLLVIVRDLDDRTVLEVLSIDNLQREDLHPLEEAQGYRNLLTLDGYNPKLVADRVGKSESYVYDRLKLLQLIPELQELFFANRFSLGHAILLARIGATDQTRVVADRDGAGGLWRRDHGHATLGLPSPDEEEGTYAGLLPVSIRQLQQWIDTHVRFDASDESVPHLFAETTATLAEAVAEKAKVVEITQDYHVQPEAKDAAGGRTYGPTSWKRADGQPYTDNGSRTDKPSKTCEYSVVGLVAVGEGRGDSFRVCVDKKRCTVHWGDEIRERNKRERARTQTSASPAAAATPAGKAKPAESSWKVQDRLRKERTSLAKKRWENGGDAVLRAIAPQVKKLAVGGNTPAVNYFLELIVDGLYGAADKGKQAAKLGLPLGATPADLIRHLIMIALIDRAEPDSYGGGNEKELQEDLDTLKLKVDVVKLLDAANPEQKVEPKKAAAKKASKKPTRKRGVVTA